MSHIEAGLWCEIYTPGLEERPALFLDRDGVVVTDTHYLGRPEELRVIEGAASAIARCNALGIPIVMVTNQSGIARGYYDWNGFHTVQAALIATLLVGGAKLDAVLACAYYDDGLEPFRIANHPWRKPNPGMMFEAARRMKIDLSRSWIVGDREGDIVSGRAAGLCGGVLISADHSEKSKTLALQSEQFAVEITPDLATAVAVLLGQGLLSI
jgi:D-glycero-D-manno-heptose 1,7-bisphosphate phosphatase